MERRDFLKVASLGAVGAMVPSPAKGEATAAAPATIKPNIVFIVSDQHRAGLTKRSGYPIDTSPTLDMLADRGIGFDRAYCTTPLCVPSRISMLTGRWPEAHHVRMNLDAKAAYFKKDLYQVAKEMGYRTGLAGKNHTYLTPHDLDFWRSYMHWEGWKPPNAPKEYHEYDQWMGRLEAEPALTPNPFPLQLQYPYRIVSDAIDFMDQTGDQPFILQVGFPEPHDPEQVPKPYWDMYPPDQVPPRCVGPEALPGLGFRANWLYGLSNTTYPSEKLWRRYKSNYLGMLRLLDDQLKRMVDHMEAKGLLKNTVIVYLADHGDYLMEYGLPRKGVGLFECLTRIPMVWSGYGVKPSQVGSSAFVSMADVMLGQREFTLEEYLQPNFLASMTPPRMDEDVSRLVEYISDSRLTSFADVMVASTLMKLAGTSGGRLRLYSARDLDQHALDSGNFVFVGGQTSNPWVSLFADKLNFEVVEDGVGGQIYFLNKKPLPGEQHIYRGLSSTGSGGEDYATISLLPNDSGQGNVLILQGLREEGTEALANMLANDTDMKELKAALKIRDGSKNPVYFEALIRAQTVAGAPVSISIVATRTISH